MPNYKRARSGRTYFFTVVTLQRVQIFASAGHVDLLRTVIRDVQASHPFEIHAAVVMPDHLHCLWTLPEGDRDYSRRWSMIKRKFTQMIGKTVPASRLGASRIKRREGFVWQRRFWEHEIRDDRDFEAHCDYIHYNPVKHGFVDRPADWAYSSFRKAVQEGYYPKDWGICEPESIRNMEFE